MAFTHGKGASVLLAQYDVSGWMNNAVYRLSADLAETTAFGSSARSYIPGFPGGTTTLSGLFDGTASTGIDAILATIVNNATPVALTVSPAGQVQGARAFIAQCVPSQYQIGTPVNDVASVSADLAYSNKTNGGFLVEPTTAITTTGVSTFVDFVTTASNGGVATLHVTANTRDAGSIAVSITDALTSGGAYSPVTGGTFTTVTAGAAASSQVLTIPGTIRQFVKASWTVTSGTTGSYTIAVGIAKT